MQYVYGIMFSSSLVTINCLQSLEWYYLH